MDNVNPFDLSDIGVSVLPEPVTPDFTKTLSLPQQKVANLQQKKADKIQKLDPNTSTGVSNAYLESLLNEGNGNVDSVPESDYIDEIQASLYKGGQSVGHMLTDATAWATSGMGDGRLSKTLQDIPFATDAQVNDIVGYDPALANYRHKQVSDSYDAFTKDPSLSGAGSLLLNAIKAVPVVAADSSDILVTMPFGGEGLFAKVATALNIASKAREADIVANTTQAILDAKKSQAAIAEALPKRVLPVNANVYEKATAQDLNLFKTKAELVNVDAKQTIERAKLLRDRGILADETSKRLEKTLQTLDRFAPINKASIPLGLGLNANQLREYKKNNNGQEASLGHALLGAAANIALVGMDFSAIKMGIIGTGAKKSAVDAVKNIFTGTRSSISDAVKHGKTYLIGKMLTNSTYEVGKVAGAGAAANYLQQWTNILNREVSDFSDTVSNKKNQKEANIAAIEGGALPAVTRTAPMAVAVPLKATGITVSNLSAKALEATYKRAKASNFAKLSKEQRAELIAKHEALQKAYDEDINIHKNSIEAINNAKTLEELKALGDPAIDEELKNTVDNHFGSKTLFKQIKAAKTVEDVKKVSGDVGTIVDDFMHNLGKIRDLKENPITDEELNNLKNIVIDSKRSANIDNETKRNSGFINTLDSKDTTLEDIINLKKDGKLSKESIGHLNEFETNSNSVKPNEPTSEEFNAIKSKFLEGSTDDATKEHINNAVTIKDLQAIDRTNIAKDSIISLNKLRKKLAKESLDNNSKKGYTPEELQSLKSTIKDIEVSNLKPIIDTHLNENIDSIKNAAIAQHNQAITTKTVKLQANRAKDYSYAMFDNIKNGVKGIGRALANQLDDATVRAIVKTARTTKDLAKAVTNSTIKGIKDSDKSTARGMLDDLVRGKTHRRLYDFTNEQLTDLAKAYPDNKKAQDVIKRIQKAKNSAAAAMGIDDIKGDTGLLDYITSSAKSMAKSPLAYKIQGLFSVGLNNLKDYKTVKKMNEVFDDLNKDGNLAEKLSPEELKHYNKLREEVKQAEEALGSAEKEKTGAEKSFDNAASNVSKPEISELPNNVSSLFKDLIGEYSKNSESNPKSTVDNILTKEKIDNIITDDKNGGNSIGTLLNYYGNSGKVDLLDTLGIHGFKPSDIEVLKKLPIREKLIEHKDAIKDKLDIKEEIGKANKTITDNLDSVRTYAEEVANAEELAASNKGTILENLGTIAIDKKAELNKAKEALEAFAKEMNIEICKA